MKNKVIVLGCSSGGLAVIRALGKRGLHVIALSHDPHDIGLSSKYVGEVAICPHPRNLDAFLEFMLEKAPLWSDLLIIETGDYYAEALSKLKPELSKHYRFVTQSWDVLSLFLEKENTYKLAVECGVPCPKTYYPESLEHLKTMQKEISFPCIIKPTQSHAFVARFKTKLFVVHTFDQLLKQYSRCLEAELPVILQEIVPGDDTTYERVHIYLNSKGKPGVEVYHKTLRLSPPRYGVMRVGATVEPLPEARELAYRLLEHAGYHTGVACFQFKRNERTGELILIEVNGRIPRSVQIDMGAEVDVPWIIYQDIVKDVQLPLEPYQETTWIELWPDILNKLVKDEKKFSDIREFIAPYLSSNKTFAIFSWSDLKPFLKQMSLLPKIAKRKMKVKSPSETTPLTEQPNKISRHELA
ncbi:MAG: hypothetical protein KDJ65_22425 [Anaerolineae bacterium]|nr:hypothetical protein [Anaerolineae bacterium]